MIRERERLNKYEYKWLIKTKKQKFHFMYMSKLHPPNTEIEGRRMNCAYEAMILGLQLGTSFVPHKSAINSEKPNKF